MITWSDAALAELDAALAELGPVLDARQFARLCGVHIETIYDGAKAGTLPVPPFKVGRALRWPTATVLETLGLASGHLTNDQVESESSQVRDGAGESCHAHVTRGGGGE